MLKVGDRVKYLNSVGGGIVKGFISPKIANVEDEAGFEVPCMVSELVKDERFESIAPQRKAPAAQVKKEEIRKPKKESLPLFASSAGKPATEGPCYFLAFVPMVPSMPLSGEIRAWLVNDSNYTLLYHFSLYSGGAFQSVKSGRLGPYQRLPLKGFDHQDFSTFPEFGFQLVPFEAASAQLVPSLTRTIRVNPVKFYKDTSFVENAYFEGRALLIEIGARDLSPQLEKLKQFDFHPSVAESGEEQKRMPKPGKQDKPELKEVDLHIHELVDNHQGLSNKEILDIQLERFRREMEEAISKGFRKIVFIHGVGQGTLKNELRRELSSRYKKYNFQDASFREYGYGATMVILRQG